jgi:hypothetical protein
MGKFVSSVASEQNARNIRTLTTATTLDLTYGWVKVTGTTTITLPAISTLSGLGGSNKTYTIENTGSAVVTVSPNSADSIGPGSASSYTLNSNGDKIVITSNRQNSNWEFDLWEPFLNDNEHIADGIISTAKVADSALTGAKLSIGTHFCAVAALTTGTTAVDLFSASGAPAAITITSVTAVAQDTNAGNMVLTNGTSAVATFAKSTTAGVVTGEDGALANTSVTSGDTVTVESSTTNGNGMVIVTFTSA